MRKILFFALFCLIFQEGYSQSKNNERMIDEIKALELKRFNAQVEKKYDVLDKILSDELVYTHSSGKVDNKTSYIESIKNGNSVYDAIESQEMNVHIFNKNTAIISGACQIKLGGAVPNVLHLRYLDVYVKNKAKEWQMVAWQALKLVQ